jgi:hypothetical protein
MAFNLRFAGNRDGENGHCQVGGPTLLKHEEMQSDLALFEFDSEDGNTPRLRVGKSAEKHGQRQAEHMKEISERPVEQVPEDKILRVADPDFVLQKKSRKGSNPKCWTSLRKGALPSAELVGLLEGVETIHDVEHDTNIGTTKAGRFLFASLCSSSMQFIRCSWPHVHCKQDNLSIECCSSAIHPGKMSLFIASIKIRTPCYMK